MEIVLDAMLRFLHRPRPLLQRMRVCAPDGNILKYVHPQSDRSIWGALAGADDDDQKLPDPQGDNRGLPERIGSAYDVGPCWLRPVGFLNADDFRRPK